VFNGRMAMLNYDVFEAFKSAGADEEKARKAAEALASEHDRFVGIDQRFMKIEAKLDLHSWMIGFALAGILAILVRVMVPV
jgi:hypothetical protein